MPQEICAICTEGNTSLSQGKWQSKNCGKHKENAQKQLTIAYVVPYLCSTCVQMVCHLLYIFFILLVKRNRGQKEER